MSVLKTLAGNRQSMSMCVCVRETLQTVLMFETVHVGNKMEGLKRVTKTRHLFTMVTLEVNKGSA